MKKSLIAIAIFLFVACDKDPVDNNPNNCEGDLVSYNGVIADVFERACNNGSCHPGTTSAWQVLPAFDSYDNILPLLESGTIESRINAEDMNLRMPPPSFEERQISEADLALLNDWICHGYPEN